MTGLLLLLFYIGKNDMVTLFYWRYVQQPASGL